MSLAETDVKNIELSDEILRKAVNCDKNFACLKQGVGCEVEYAVNKEILFVKDNGQMYCNYRMFYGDGTICMCPVRLAIYNKYHI